MPEPRTSLPADAAAELLADALVDYVVTSASNTVPASGAGAHIASYLADRAPRIVAVVDLGSNEMRADSNGPARLSVTVRDRVIAWWCSTHGGRSLTVCDSPT